MSHLEPTLLGMPREVRNRIFELLWNSPGYVRLASRPRSGNEVVAQEKQVHPYPPRTTQATDENVDTPLERDFDDPAENGDGS